MYRSYIYTFIVRNFGMKTSKVLSHALVSLHDICKNIFSSCTKSSSRWSTFFKKLAFVKDIFAVPTQQRTEGTITLEQASMLLEHPGRMQ